MGDIGVPELLIILAILLICFGPSRLTGLGKSLGDGIRSFRESVRVDTPPVDTEPSHMLAHVLASRMLHEAYGSLLYSSKVTLRAERPRAMCGIIPAHGGKHAIPRQARDRRYAE